MKFNIPHSSGKVLLALLAIHSCPSIAVPLSSEQISQMMTEKDPVIVVRQLHKDNHGESWRNTLAQIKTGNPDWLGLSKSLEKGTGTKSAEQLMDAVARAIPENPSGVLNLLNEKNIYLNTANICSLPLLPTNSHSDETFKTNALDAIKAQPEGVSCTTIMQQAISYAHKMPAVTH